MKHLITLTVALAIALAVAMHSAPGAFAQADFVYHQADSTQIKQQNGGTITSDTCGVGGVPDYQMRNGIGGMDVYYKVQYQFGTNQGWLYYTMDGTTPAGFLGVATNGTAVSTSFVCTFTDSNNGIVDIWHALIPPPASGSVTVSFIIEQNCGTGCTGGPQTCSTYANSGSCATGSSGATVFTYKATTSPTLAAVSRLTIHHSGTRTTLRWYSAEHVLGFNVYDGKAHLNHRLVTSHTRWYTFTYPHAIHHLHIRAVTPSGAIKS